MQALTSQEPATEEFQNKESSIIYGNYFIVKDKETPWFYRISPKKGRTPDMLVGKYTAPRFAKDRIDSYEAKKA